MKGRKGFSVAICRRRYLGHIHCASQLLYMLQSNFVFRRTVSFVCVRVVAAVVIVIAVTAAAV